MHRSSALARIVTTLVTLLAVPIALFALSTGGCRGCKRPCSAFR
jgi:biotin synthase-related radical SAM superfamily protein